MTPDIIVITPRPPICIKSRITACPKKLHVEKVGRVTSPVTQVEVVAVKSASRYDTGLPLAELIGRLNRKLPMSIVIRKLNSMI